MAENETHATLGVISFGLALGTAWAIGVALLAIVAGLFGWGVALAAVLQSLYIGYGPSFVGAVAGAVWGFADGFIFGMLIAWLYNRFLLTRRLPLRPVARRRASKG